MDLRYDHSAISRRWAIGRILAGGSAAAVQSVGGALPVALLPSSVRAQAADAIFSWIAAKLADAAWQRVFGSGSSSQSDDLQEVERSVDSAILNAMASIKEFIQAKIEEAALLRIQGNIQGALLDITSYEAAPAQTAYRISSADTKCTTAIGEALLYGDAGVPALTMATTVRLIALITNYRLYRDAGELVNIKQMVGQNGAILSQHLANIEWYADVKELSDMHSHDRQPLIYRRTEMTGDGMCRNFYEVPGQIDWLQTRLSSVLSTEVTMEEGPCNGPQLYQAALKQRQSEMSYLQERSDKVMAPYVIPALKVLRTWNKIAALAPSSYG